MSRARERREQAKLKRQAPEDDTDESEWDDVSGYELGGDDPLKRQPDEQGVTE